MENNRTSLLIRNTIASFVLKGWSAIVVLTMVPLTLKMLGVYNNGVWLTISSILMWVNLLDIGLGNGLRNSVAKYVALNDPVKVRQAISSTFFMLSIVTIPIVCLSGLFLWNADIYELLNIDKVLVPNLRTVLIVAIIFTANTFILKAVGNFYMGMQLPAVNNLIVCIGQTLSLLITYLAYYTGNRSLLTVVIINTSAPLLAWCLSLPYTFGYKYTQYKPHFRYIDLNLSKKLCSVGMQFFFIQICGLILFSSSNIIISKMFSPADVTPYQIACRYFNIAFIIFSTICMPFWNATTDAFARNDYSWITKNLRILDLLSLGTIVLLCLMIALSDYVYVLWIGDEPKISLNLSISVAAYIAILTISQRYSIILNGLNIIKIQMVFTGIATIIFLPLAWIACKSFTSVESLVWVMCFVNIPGLFANMWKYYRIIPKAQTSIKQ